MKMPDYSENRSLNDPTRTIVNLETGELMSEWEYYQEMKLDKAMNSDDQDS